jgi:hypothetical protein
VRVAQVAQLLEQQLEQQVERAAVPLLLELAAVVVLLLWVEEIGFAVLVGE